MSGFTKTPSPSWNAIHSPGGSTMPAAPKMPATNPTVNTATSHAVQSATRPGTLAPSTWRTLCTRITSPVRRVT